MTLPARQPTISFVAIQTPTGRYPYSKGATPVDKRQKTSSLERAILKGWKRVFMSQSLSNILLHLVFNTKNREPLILPELEPDLYA